MWSLMRDEYLDIVEYLDGGNERMSALNDWHHFFCVQMRINKFWGDVTVTSAKTKSRAASCQLAYKWWRPLVSWLKCLLRTNNSFRMSSSLIIILFCLHYRSIPKHVYFIQVWRRNRQCSVRTYVQNVYHPWALQASVGIAHCGLWRSTPVHCTATDQYTYKIEKYFRLKNCRPGLANR